MKNKYQITILQILSMILITNWIFAQTPKTDRFAIFSVPKSENTWTALDSLGVGWIRLQNQMGEANQQLVIQFFSRALSEGYGLWITLHNRDRSNVEDTVLFDNSTRGSFPPQNAEVYKNLVKSNIQPLVDLLLSQGKEPSKWLVIQFSNEVLPSDVLPDSPSRFFHGTSDEYLSTLSLTYSAVKSINSSIPVAFGAISSGSLEAILEYNNNPVDSLQKLVDWNTRLLTEGQFDWADIHLYHAISTIAQKVSWIKTLWNGPLAVTEDGGPDERTGTPYSEEAQAELLPDRINTTLDAGVNRVFWSFLQDINIPGDQLAQTLGLITLTWRYKEAFNVYKNLINNNVTSVNDDNNIPLKFKLFQNYPNPFNPTTTIKYSVPSVGISNSMFQVKIIVYDILGKLFKILINKNQLSGTYQIKFDASSIPSGVYFYRLHVGNFVQTRKMILLR